MNEVPIGRLFVCITLGIASLYDIRSREIPDLLLYAAIVLGALGFLVEIPLYGYVDLVFRNPVLLLASTLLDVIALSTVYILCKLKMKGDADLLALLAMTASSPIPLPPATFFPSSIMVLIYYGAIIVPMAIAIAVVNIVKYRSLLKPLPLRVKVIYMFTAVPIKVKKLMQNPSWWYPLQTCEGYNLGFDVYEDPHEVAARVREYVKRGCFSADDYIWSSYGLPAIPLLLLGFIIYTFLGDAPLLYILKALVRG